MKRLRLSVLTILVLSALAAGAVWSVGDRRSQEETATPSAQPEEFGGPFSLTDQNGERRTDKDFRGKYMLIFFGYTYCPDVCPTALAVQAEALEQLGPDAGRIAPIFISVDPERDTPDALKSYLAAFDPGPPSQRPGFVGLTGTEDEIAAVAGAYRVYYSAHIGGHEGSGAYSIDHTGNVYLMSPEGKFVAYYSPGILPDEMAADLKSRMMP